VKLALYKGTRPGISGIYNRLTRLLDRGIYSHCELVFGNGVSASSSFLDGGVRFKAIEYSQLANWDFMDLSSASGRLEASAMDWFKKHEGERYDLWGNLRFATGFARDCDDKWFCSESVLAALGFSEAYRYGPSGMAALLQHHFQADFLTSGVHS
jgi:uncharacterized protein YycO